MKNPLISIIVPIYNMASCLSYCIDSLLQQTYTNLELLLIDDGSKDNSLEVCHEYASKDARCKVFHQENSGVGAARNLGLSHAKGQYISFVDSDDYVEKDFIEILYKSLTSGNYDFSMVNYESTFKHNCHDTSVIPQGRVFTQRLLMNGLFNRSLKGSVQCDEVIFIITCNKLYKKALLEGLFFNSNTLSEDLEFNNRVFLRSHQAIFVDVKKYFYFQKENSASRKPIDKKYINQLLSHFQCLETIPKNYIEYRAACLLKLFKTIFSTRYLMRHIKDKKDIDLLINNIGNQSLKEFIQNRYISINMKFLFIVFYYFPLTYKCFVAFCERKARRGNN